MEKKVSRRDFLKASVAASAVVTAGATLPARGAYAKELRPIQLSKPESPHADALLKVLEKRSSSREFAPDPLPVAVLSNVLWAGFGINRPDGRRTAPSANNRQEIDIYVAAPDGLYLFNAKAQALQPVSGDDIRALTGRQAYVAAAAVNLVYVADIARVGGATKEDKILLSGADTAFIAENVYLYCAAEGLATVVRADIDRAPLAKAMKLRQDQTITLAQCVGYPKKKA
jgi:nitroreductase